MGTEALKDVTDLKLLMLSKEARRSKIQIMIFDAAIYLICTILGLLVIFYAG